MRTTLFLAVLVAAVLAAGSAQGVTPGKNGLIYFENFNEVTQTSDIYVVNADGSGLRNISNTESSDETEPAVSPDSKLVAFVSNEGTDAFHLRVMNNDGTGQRTLSAASGAQQGSPAWSPKGDQIAFSRCAGIEPE